MDLSLEDYLKGIQNRDRTILARAITLVESKKQEHQALSQKLLSSLGTCSQKKSRRIAISGTPGVGKSTFIDSFGDFLIQNKKSIAVLALDPTSEVTGGSILGDKTRMEKLAASREAFIRPTGNGAKLGGIGAHTREAILICEAFGFDYIFVETVGVGQAETSVAKIVDMFILLMQPGSGDDLQGIKRGILEVSDLVLVNKSDGEYQQMAKVSQHDYQNSLDVLQSQRNWKSKVLRTSGLYLKNAQEVLDVIEDYFKNYSWTKRKGQLASWALEMALEKLSIRLLTIGNEKDIFSDLYEGKVDLQGAVGRLISEVKADND